MRLAGQIKQGYFPAPSEAIAALCSHLKTDEGTNILDPCAGEAAALTQIAAYLDIPSTSVYAIELNAARAQRIGEAHPELHLLGPCSFMGAKISKASFSCVYLNPPFDSEMGGGGREETFFLRYAMPLLVPHGIMILVCPANQVYGQSQMCELLDAHFECVRVYRFPAEHRKFKEVVVIGRKRKTTLSLDKVEEHGTLHSSGIAGAWAGYADHAPELGQSQYAAWSYGKPLTESRLAGLEYWTLPPAPGPSIWQQMTLTQEQVEAELERSPLYGIFDLKPDTTKRRPPLPLGKGHTSTLLVAGELDGYMATNPPHVVRGFCGKVLQLKSVSHHETASGNLAEVRKYADVPQPVLRAIWPDGSLVEYKDSLPEEHVTDNGENGGNGDEPEDDDETEEPCE